MIRWLEKNKDPLNDSVVDVMKNAPNQTLPIVFKVIFLHLFSNTVVERIYEMNIFCKNDFSLLKDLAGHAVEAEQEPGKKKKGGGKTVGTQNYLVHSCLCSGKTVETFSKHSFMHSCHPCDNKENDTGVFLLQGAALLFDDHPPLHRTSLH